MVDFLNKQNPENITEVYWQRFGDVQTIHFYRQFENVIELEKMSDQPFSQEFLTIWNKGPGLFVEGYNEVTIIQSF